uniref:U box n=1 Tax=Medicago truncatula TaxID=3880 RepID=A2Q499_MEDTR|nr:U box [Medicago truncatula]
MRDPVILSSGHTYDRISIPECIDSGQHTCLESEQRLIHNALIPNYVLKSLVHQW